jgi:hypothetical protein
MKESYGKGLGTGVRIKFNDIDPSFLEMSGTKITNQPVVFEHDQMKRNYRPKLGQDFIVGGFGSVPFQMNGGRGEANAAVHKAAGPGEPVTQEVAASVKGYKIDCSINGTVVASYEKAALITEGKLKSADDAYEVRFAHNTDVLFSGLTVSK